MGPTSMREYIHAIYQRYATATRAVKHQILDEFCATTGYHRKSAIRALQAPPPRTPRRHRRQPQTYGSQTIAVLATIWEAAGYPWSRRLKALLPLWLPWAKRRFAIPSIVELQLLTISPPTIDRRLQPRRRQLKRRLYLPIPTANSGPVGITVGVVGDITFASFTEFDGNNIVRYSWLMTP